MSVAAESWAKAPSFDDRPEVRARLRERTAADRREQLEGGLRSVECARCGSCVLAKKNSPDHTSIQWTAEAVENCPELTTHAPGGNTAHVDGCPDLSASVNQSTHAPDSETR